MSNPTLDCARFYISQGWHVIPLYSVIDGMCSCPKGKECSSPGKHPHAGIVPNGAKQASCNREDVECWFSDYGPVNIGICAGTESQLVILDVDPRHGGDESLKRYNVPETVTVATGGGGWHYYFKHPGGDVRNSAGKIGLGLDVRGYHGYVVAPPSNHLSGGMYKFHRCDPRKTPLAVCPDWISKPPKKDCSSTEELSKGEAIPHGKQHQTLVSIAGSLRKRGMAPDEIYAALSVINQNRCEKPGPEENIRRIADDMESYEQGNITNKPKIVSICMADVQPREVKWLWEPYVPLEETTLIMGPGSAGKSTLLAWMASRVSSGGKWFRGNGNRPSGSVIILSDEENLETQLRPKLDANGADTKKVHTIKHIEFTNGKTDFFAVNKYVEALDDFVAELGDCKLVIMDPITAYLSGVNANDNAEVRTAMLGINELARKYGLSIVCNNHLNKKQDLDLINRALGSVAFVNAVRSVIAVVKEMSPDKKFTGNRLLGGVKCNLSRDEPDTVMFRIENLGVHFSDEAPTTSISEASSGASGAKPKKNNEEFENWLIKRLSNGSAPAEEIKLKSEEMGVKERTMYYIAKKLGVLKEYGAWRIPKDECPI